MVSQPGREGRGSVGRRKPSVHVPTAGLRRGGFLSALSLASGCHGHCASALVDGGKPLASRVHCLPDCPLQKPLAHGGKELSLWRSGALGSDPGVAACLAVGLGSFASPLRWPGSSCEQRWSKRTCPRGLCKEEKIRESLRTDQKRGHRLLLSCGSFLGRVSLPSSSG